MVLETAISATKSAREQALQQALDLAASAKSAFRVHDSVAVALPGGMFGQVRDGKLISIGLEPIGDVIVDAQHKVTSMLDGDKGRVLWGRVAAVVGGSAAAASSIAAGVVAAVVLGRRRSAAAA